MAPDNHASVVGSALAEEWLRLPKRRLSHAGRWLVVALAAAIMALIVWSMATNSNFGWSTVARYVFAASIMRGLFLTIQLAVSALVMGILLGYVLAAMQRSRFRSFVWFAKAYVWIFRSIPQLIQIIWWYNLSVLYPRLTLTIPLLGFDVFDVSTNDVMQKYTAALLALTLAQAAYQAEIIRGALLAPSPTQREAAYAIGMTSGQTMWRIIIPQAVRSFIPPAGNEFAHLIKGTSVVAFITLADLTYSVQLVYNQNYQVIPLLIVASVWYLLLVGVVSLLQSAIERSMKW